jgi:hypothetical protein
LNIGAKSEFSGEAVSELAKSIEKMKELETLKINFDEGNCRSEENMDELGKSLNQLHKLKEFKIVYGDMENCGENCLMTLLANVEEKPLLQDIYLSAG